MCYSIQSDYENMFFDTPEIGTSFTYTYTHCQKSLDFLVTDAELCGDILMSVTQRYSKNLKIF